MAARNAQGSAVTRGRRVVVDTNVLILAFAGQEPFADFLSGLIREDRLLLSSLAVAEFLVGSDRLAALTFLNIAERSTVLPVGMETARLAAQFRHEFHSRRIKVPLLDCLIAAQCSLAGAELATLNSRDYPKGMVDLVAFGGKP